MFEKVLEKNDWIYLKKLFYFLDFGCYEFVNKI